MNLRRRRGNSLLKRSMIKKSQSKLRQSNLLSLIRNLRPNLKKKPNKRKNKRNKQEKITPTCTNKSWPKMTPEMELIVEVAISKLLLINRQSRIMLLMCLRDLEICQTFLMLSQKTKKKKRKK